MTAVSFLTGGDVAPIRDEAAGMFGGVAAPFRGADVSFFNLELPLSERGEPCRGKGINHRGKPLNVEGLVDIGVTCVNLANNHILDFGEDAFFDTLALLDAKKIGRFGAGRSAAEARKGLVVEKNGLRVGFLGYSTTLPTGFAATAAGSGVNPLRVHTGYEATVNPVEYPGHLPAVVTRTEPADLQRLRDDVRVFGKSVDVLLVYMHWGTSMTPRVQDFQTELGHAAIEAGAHAVFGGHQHVLSPIEFHQGRPIVHCSANLLFDTWTTFFNDENRKTFLFGATLEKGGLRDCRVMPARTGVGAPPLLLAQGDPLWRTIVDDLAMRSRPYGTQFTPRDGAVEVRPAA